MSQYHDNQNIKSCIIISINISINTSSISTPVEIRDVCPVSYHSAFAIRYLSMLFLFPLSDLEPEWLDDIQKNGELFYLELSEGEEEAALAQATANQGVSTNHVRFSEKEAEVITEQNKKQRCGSRTKNEPTLKRLARILRKKRRPSQRRGGGKDGGKDNSTLSSPPASILKNQPGQKQGVMVQQQQLKEVCVYLNPKRLGGSSTLISDSGGLLEALLGVMHRPSWGRGQGDPALVRKQERLTVHGLIPNSPAIKCGQILIGKTLISSVSCYKLGIDIAVVIISITIIFILYKCTRLQVLQQSHSHGHDFFRKRTHSL